MMKIAYIRGTFPKKTETFILEEIVHLKKTGHELRIFANWYDLSNVSPKIQDNDLLSCVAFLDLRGWSFPSFVRELPRFAAKLTTARYRKAFLHDLFPSRELRAELKNLIWREAGGNWLKRGAALARDALTIAGYAMRLGNFSLGLQQGILDRSAFVPAHIHTPFLFRWDALATQRLRSEFPDATYSVALRSRDVYSVSHDAAYLDLRTHLIENADRVFAISEYNKSQFSGVYSTRHEIKVVHSSIDADLFVRDSSVAIAPGRIVCVARLVPKKGIQLLLQACRELLVRGVGFELFVVGDGPLRAELMRLTEGLGLKRHVRFLGAVSHQHVRAMLNTAEVFALPCVVADDSDRDILPNSLKEAMAMQLVVVTTDISGIGELVTHGVDGLLARPDNVSDLAENLQLALTDRDFIRSAGGLARDKILSAFSISTEGAAFCAELARVRSPDAGFAGPQTAAGL